MEPRTYRKFLAWPNEVLYISADFFRNATRKLGLVVELRNPVGVSSQLKKDARLSFGVSVPVFTGAWVKRSQIDIACLSVRRAIVEVTASVDVGTSRIVSCRFEI